jgi:uncharacterized protein YfaT (DUF1175 family)
VKINLIQCETCGNTAHEPCTNPACHEHHEDGGEARAWYQVMAYEHLATDPLFHFCSPDCFATWARKRSEAG